MRRWQGAPWRRPSHAPSKLGDRTKAYGFELTEPPYLARSFFVCATSVRAIVDDVYNFSHAHTPDTPSVDGAGTGAPPRARAAHLQEEEQEVGAAEDKEVKHAGSPPSN